MHIAIYDDNIADRKQTERLLSRESDRRKSERGEGYFIDSYGNIEALMHYPQMYGIFFVDTCYSAENGLDIARMLTGIGCNGRIVLLCSERYDYRAMAAESGMTERCHFLDKPIRVQELRDMLVECEDALGEPIPVIELRSDTHIPGALSVGPEEGDSTIMARESEIMYALAHGPSMLEVVLKDGRKVEILESATNFYDQCAALGMGGLCPVSGRAVINVRYISSNGLLSVTMENGRRIGVHPLYFRNIGIASERYRSDQ